MFQAEGPASAKALRLGGWGKQAGMGGKRVGQNRRAAAGSRDDLRALDEGQSVALTQDTDRLGAFEQGAGMT